MCVLIAICRRSLFATFEGQVRIKKKKKEAEAFCAQMAAVNVLWERRSDAPVRFSLVPRELLEVYVPLFSYIPVPQDSLTKVSASACLSSPARPSSSPSSSHSSPSSSSSSVPQLLFRGSAWSPPPASHHPAALHLHYWVLFLQVPFRFTLIFCPFSRPPFFVFHRKSPRCEI